MFLDKCMNFLGISREEYEDEEVALLESGSECEEQVETQEVQETKLPRFGYGFRRNADRRKEDNLSVTPKVIPMAGNIATSKMVITQPTCFEDVKEIGEHLKTRKSVIVNLETLNKDDQRRIIDFMSGSAFVLDGSIQKISSLIYLVTPKTIEIQNEIERAQYSNKLPFTWMK